MEYISNEDYKKLSLYLRKSLPCPTCERMFTTTQTLNRHMKSACRPVGLGVGSGNRKRKPENELHSPSLRIIRSDSSDDSDSTYGSTTSESNR